jgi:AcrR family transcriptional regulator
MSGFLPTALNPPKQPRSKRTLERIVRAALDILEEEGPSGVTVQAVVARAESSVGSFYARFGGKDDLLEYLGSRIWGDALERWNAAFAARSWADMALAELASGASGLLFDVRRSRVAGLRAVDRMVEGTGAFEAFRTHLLGDLETLLLERREEIVHETPERAVRLGLRAVLGVLDAGVEPEGAGEEEAREVLVGECRELLLSYLTGRPAAGDAAQVDFFDVWG